MSARRERNPRRRPRRVRLWLHLLRRYECRLAADILPTSVIRTFTSSKVDAVQLSAGDMFLWVGLALLHRLLRGARCERERGRSKTSDEHVGDAHGPSGLSGDSFDD